MPPLHASLLEFLVGHILIKPQGAVAVRSPVPVRLILREMKRALVLLVLAVCVAFAEASNPEMEVRQALAQFVQALDNLDRDRFAGFFSDDATMFQPRRFVSRAESRREIESQFRQIFPGIRGD
jgi:hypothetical protein